MLQLPGVMRILQNGLTAASLRHTAISHNLANANTPNFKALAVRFEDLLAGALQGKNAEPLQRTDPRHLGWAATDPTQVQPVVVRDESRTGRSDGSSVDVEAEMAKLAGNQLSYSALTRQVSDEFRRLRLAITGGRR